MSSVARFFRSSIGGKIVVAVTGAAMFLFVVVHMIGNLQIYIGQEPLNRYAAMLKSLPELLWAARAGLLAFIVFHVFASIRLAAANRAARPIAYSTPATVQATLASRTMLWTGPMVAAFIIFHILHFTMGAVQPEFYELKDSHGRHDVYSMVIHGFKNVPISLSYIVAMLLLGVHLRHGVSSLFQTLGLKNGKYAAFIDRVGFFAAWGIVIGNVSIPLSILAGLIQLPSS